MIWIWVGFLVFVLLMLALDLGVFHRKAHVIGMKEALIWSAVWITLALLFTFFIYFGYENHWLGLGKFEDPVDRVVNDGKAASIKYLTGYIIEKSLSVDNIFVIAVLFGYFAVPAKYQHRVLFWGILGALVMRGVMIGLGAQLIARWHWILYIFGVFLIFTAYKMLFIDTDDETPTENAIVRLARRWFPVTPEFHGHHFVIQQAGRTVLTPLALALIMVETTDLIFAVDSIPAIFAITADPFIVFTSNVFAILGLRSLYFALASMMDKFRYLKVSLAIVLAIVGIKMLIADWLKHFIGPQAFNFVLLGLVLVVLTAGVVASLFADRRDSRRAAARSGDAPPPGHAPPRPSNPHSH